MNRLLIITLFFQFAFKTIAQLPVGAWRDHLPYSSAKRIAEVNNRIFCATTGGLFSYNTADNSIQKYSKVNGLSDSDIGIIGYSDEAKTLVITYLNGNLDLIKGDTIINLPDIMMRTLSGEKSINNIFFYHSQAYLACDFGIVLVDLNRNLIMDTYFIGPGGSQIKINDITSDGIFLYAATVEGIYKANLNNPNLVDYNAWDQVTQLPSINVEYKHLAFFAGKLFTYYKNSVTNLDNIITFNNTGWNKWEMGYDDRFTFLCIHNNHLVFSSYYRTDIYNENEIQVSIFSSIACQHGIYSKENTVWFADPEKGLGIAETSGNRFIVVNGPAYRDVGDIVTASSLVWAGGGNNATRWASKGAYSFVNEKWNSYNYKTIPELEGFYNISQVAIDPSDHEHVYGGSLGFGVVEFNNGILVDIFDETDGVLEPVPGYGHGFVNVVGMNFDEEGSLWISTSLTDDPVYRIKSDRTWEKMRFNYSGFGIGTQVGDILPASNGQIWLLLERYGVFVFTADNTGPSKERAIIIKNQEGDLLDRTYSIAEDRDGNIWIGTNKGPVIFYNPYDIFDKDEIIGYQVKIPRNDGTNNADILLATEKITTIAVDGGDRKWLGTENSGVFLVSPDGKEEIYHFTSSNSPLPSNNISSIAINHINGEVYIGTDKGIYSYRGQSTVGNADFSNAYIFPNPVRENYQGDIVISGLADNVNIKITDVAGNLVFETFALGGQAIWDGKNFRGQKVHSGVYLVFCSNEDGSKTYTMKLLVIH